MYQTITFSAFCDAFRDMNRNENFSYAGKRALYDYLEDCADQTGEDVELDVIALCCEYAESSLEEVIQDYSIDVADAEDDDEKADIVEDYLQDNTCLVARNGETFIYAQF